MHINNLMAGEFFELITLFLSLQISANWREYTSGIFEAAI